MANYAQKIRHHGAVQFGDLSCEVVVLPDGTRGYVRQQVARLFNYDAHLSEARFTQFINEYAPEGAARATHGWASLELPNGRVEQFFPVGVLPELTTNLLGLVFDNDLSVLPHLDVLQNCLLILHRLTQVSEGALIDEATGFQESPATRVDAALGRLLDQSAPDWIDDALSSYYQALASLYGWPLRPGDPAWPQEAKSIAWRWVYPRALLPEALAELKSGNPLSSPIRSWLDIAGYARLATQFQAVAALAQCAASPADLELRCQLAFNRGPLALFKAGTTTREAA